MPEEYQEVFFNLSRCAGLQLPNRTGKSGAGFSIGAGVIFVATGTLLMLLAIWLFINDIREDDIHYLPTSLVVGSAGIWIAILLGVAQFYKAQVVSMHSRYVDLCLQELMSTGKVVTGEVISSSYITEHYRQIKYQFPSPDDGRSIFGSYITSARKDFPPRSQVVVYYLNRYMHVLL